jgi:hypothetical protein
VETDEEKKKTDQQAWLDSIGEQLASLAAQPLMLRLSTIPAEARMEPTEGQLAATEAAKVDPSNCLMETPVLRENQKGIRNRRTTNQSDFAQQCPRALEYVFLSTLCGPRYNRQAQPESVSMSSDVRGSCDQRVSSDVREGAKIKI